MDRKYIDEHHIVARYLADELSAAEREAFEEYYVDDPEIVKDLEAAARFKAGLALARRNQQLPLTQAARPWWREQSRQLLAAAASLLIAMGVAYFVYGYPPFQPVLVAQQSAIRNWRGALPLADYRLVTKSRRGSEAEIELPPSPQVLELRLLLDEQPSPPYRAILSRSEDARASQIIGTLDGLQLSEEGFVRLFINSSRLRGGNYRVVIAGSNDTEAEYQIVFR